MKCYIAGLGDGAGIVSRDSYGAKAESLATLFDLHLPIPEGFVISAFVARYFFTHMDQKNPLPPDFDAQLRAALAVLERETGAVFGANENPLIVSVRSGAAVSMPGMMSTILNLGLNDSNIAAFARQHGAWFAYDTYQRFIQMFAVTVLGVSAELFVGALSAQKQAAGVDDERHLSADQLQELCDTYHGIVAASGHVFPQDPYIQLRHAIMGVFGSWNSLRARTYRASKGIAESLGTAAVVQRMVFGNLNDRSGTGVVFSRDPNTGANVLRGDFALLLQGEDIVNGSRLTFSIAEMRRWNQALHAQLSEAVRQIERHCGEIVEVEFTIQWGKLYLLQWRPAKKSVVAAIEFAVHGVVSGWWSQLDAVKRVPDISELFRKAFAHAEMDRFTPAVQGIGAAHGAAIGHAVFSWAAARDYSRRGLPIVFFSESTSTEDLPIMLDAKAIVTKCGGEASHAAVVARELNKPAVVGCSSLRIDKDGAEVETGRIGEGDIVSVDGATGCVYAASLKLEEPALNETTRVFIEWWQQLALKEHQPRLRLDIISNVRLDVNAALSNLYLLEMMLVAAVEDTALYRDVREARDEQRKFLAEFDVAYLMMAVAGELRHATTTRVRFSENGRAANRRLKLHFGVAEDTASRIAAQTQVLRKMQHLSHQEHVEFFALAVEVFSSTWIDTQIGGSKWADIARAAFDYLSGRVSQMIFVDHVFDLEHNGGELFDKNKMAECVRAIMSKQLTAKRDAVTVAQLYDELTALHPKVSPQVETLWLRGRSKGIW